MKINQNFEDYNCHCLRNFGGVIELRNEYCDKYKIEGLKMENEKVVKCQKEKEKGDKEKD